jgi:hypothetical protein
VFRTIIPRNVRLAEAPSFGKPALLHDKDSRGALAYLALAGEMIRREDEEGRPAQPAAGSQATAPAAPRATSAAAPVVPEVTDFTPAPDSWPAAPVDPPAAADATPPTGDGTRTA